MSTIAVKLLFADVKLLQFALMLLDYPLLKNLQRNLLIIFEIWYIFFLIKFSPCSRVYRVLFAYHSHSTCKNIFFF